MDGSLDIADQLSYRHFSDARNNRRSFGNSARVYLSVGLLPPALAA